MTMPNLSVINQSKTLKDDTFSCSNEVQGLEGRIDDIVNDNDGHPRASRDNQNTNASSKGTPINLNRRETAQINNLDDNGNVRSIAKENLNFQDDRACRPLSQESSAIKLESKIPIFFSRGMTSTKINDQASNLSSDHSYDQVNVKLRKKIVYNSDNKNSAFKARSKNIGLETTYQRRKRLQQDATSPISLLDNQVTNRTSDSRSNTYRPLSCTINSKYTEESQENISDEQNVMSKVVSQEHPPEVLVNKRYSRSSDGHLRFPRTSSVERPHPISET